MASPAKLAYYLIAFVTTANTQARAQFGPYLDLAETDGTNAKLFMGALRDSGAGWDAAGADLNGDGYKDLILSAPGPGEVYPLPGDMFPGTVYVVFGGPTFDDIVTMGLEELDGTNGFAIEGPQPEGSFGESLVAGFDWNGDGIEDLAVAAPFNVAGTHPLAGQVFVIFGRAGIGADGTFDITSLDGTNGFVINGAAFYDALGVWMAMAAGDLNGDGWPDLAMGASGYMMPGRSEAGRTFVLFGGPGVGSGGSVDLANLDGSNGFVINGIAASDAAYYYLHNLGDLNGDGADDLTVEAPGADVNGMVDAGQVYVVFGGPQVGGSGVLELADLDGSNGFYVNPAPDHHIGFVGAPGDVNGDGLADISVGRSVAHTGGAYVLFGAPDVGSSGVIEVGTIAWPAGAEIVGDVVSWGVGDVNGDGFADVPFWNPTRQPFGRIYAGQVTIVFGDDQLGSDGPIDASGLDGTDGFYVYGDQAGRQIGLTFPLGDLNRDGVDDFGIRCRVNRPPDQGHGGLFVLFGRSRFALGDLDRDGDVDDSDFASFVLCYNGSSRPPGPACPEGLDADFNNDGDVDLDDFSILAANYTGPR